MAIIFNGSQQDPAGMLGPEALPMGGDKVVEVRDPVTRAVLGVVPVATSKDQSDAALDAAESGLRSWASVPMWRRAEVVLDFAARMRGEADALSVLMAKNMGRAIRECRAEIEVSVALAQGFAERAKHLYGEVMPQSQPGLEADLVFTQREPLGVVLAIIPFNAPVELFVHKVVPALLMGNAVVVKVPMPNPLCPVELAKLLVEAGVPAEAVGLVYSEGPFASEYLVQSPRVAAVTFTGSTATGMAINKSAASNMHRVFLELGGNDPFIVTEDADLPRAAKELVNTRMMNSGQVCCSSKRALIPAAVADTFVDLVREEVSTVAQGDPLSDDTQVGSLVTEAAALRVKDQVDRAVAQGARCLVGGNIRDKVFFEPTVLVDVDRNSDVAHDMEIFGPVISIITYHDVDEAVDIANQTSYGLQASVLAGNVEDAMRLARRLHAGMVVVNGAGSYRHIDMPFGGTKGSGGGREGIGTTLEEFSEQKSYVVKGVMG
jgi:succinate-semialdehyde dehydrogenase/glutarate-semialdehyde dehydrogenase